MVCKNCGKENNDELDICTHCGEKVNAIDVDNKAHESVEHKDLDINKINERIKKLTTAEYILLSIAALFEFISIYIEDVALLFALLGTGVLIAYFILAIIKHKLYKKINPPKKKTKAKSKKQKDKSNE